LQNQVVIIIYTAKGRSDNTRKKMSSARGGLPISLISIEDQTILKVFSSSRARRACEPRPAAGEYFFCCNKTILRYVRSGKVFKDKYLLKQLPTQS
jgi:hypothetical protein